MSPLEVLPAGALGTRVLVADGAMGTVLHAAGSPLDRALPELNLTEPELVAQVHEGYLEVGVDILQTNTFGASRLRLGALGLAGDTAAVNAAGVRIARDVAATAGRPVLVAGSVSPAVSVRQRRGVAPADRVAALAEQVSCLVEAGVELLVLETFGFLDELLEAVGVAVLAGVPVIAQATFSADGRTLSGHVPAQVAAALAGTGIAALGTNCTLGPQGVLGVVEALAEHTDLPIAAQPNAGMPRRTRERRVEFEIDAGYVARYAERLVRAGASIVGGCCGTTPAHLAAVVEAVRDTPSRPVVATRRVPATAPARPLLVEIDAPFPDRLDAAQDVVRAAVHAGVEQVVIGTGSGPRARLGAVDVALRLHQALGVDATVTVTAWDRTIMSLQADLLGAHALGLRRVVAETGSPPLMGDYPLVDGVWEVDSLGLVELLAALNAGTDRNGLPMPGGTAFEIAARVNPGATDLDAEAERALRKVAAGAHVLLTRPVYERDALAALRERMGDTGVPLLVTVRPLRDFAEAEYLRHEVPDVVVPDEVLATLRRAGRDAPRAALELAVELARDLTPLSDGLALALPDEADAAARLLGAVRTDDSCRDHDSLT